MEQKIKDLRIEIDGIAQLTKGLKGQKIPTVGFGADYSSKGVKDTTLTISRECHRCYDSLIFAKAHLGKVLGVLNVETPYKNDGKRKDVKDIEPTADKNEDIHGYNLDVVHFGDKNHIERVDYLRQRIKDLANKINIGDDRHVLWQEINEAPSSVHFIFNAFNHLTEARFWLGFELERIREEEI